MHHSVVAIGRAPNATFNSVANHRTSTKVRNVDPKFLAQVVLDQVVVKIAIRISNKTLASSIRDSHESDSWLEKSKSTIHIDVQNLAMLPISRPILPRTLGAAPP
jgi:hypothetical protein